MKVSCATQVFSHTVASAINLLARSGKYIFLILFQYIFFKHVIFFFFIVSGIKGPDDVTLDMSAVGTAKILKLFDSCSF